MTSWDETYERLRAQYVRNAAARIERIEAAFASLETRPDDADALADLHREYHGLAGSGRIYGFIEVSELGREGERDIAAAIEAVETPSQERIGLWKGLLDRIRFQFEASRID